MRFSNYKNNDSINDDEMGTISSSTIVPPEETEDEVFIFFHWFVSLPSNHIDPSS